MLNNLISLYNGGAAASTTSYESIATVTVGAGGSSTITFSSIPSTYKHLQIRYVLLSSTATANQAIQFNSDTGANYARHILYGNGSSASASASTGNVSIRVSTLTGASSSYPSVAVIDILDYTNTNKYTTVRTLAGTDQNGAGEAALLSGLWLNTNAITDITITGGGTLTQYSSFALYGVK